MLPNTQTFVSDDTQDASAKLLGFTNPQRRWVHFKIFSGIKLIFPLTCIKVTPPFLNSVLMKRSRGGARGRFRPRLPPN